MKHEVFNEVLKAVNDDQNLNANNVVEKIDQEFERNLNELYCTYSDNRYKYTKFKEEHEKWKKDGCPLNYSVSVAARNGCKNIILAMVEAGADVNGTLDYTTLHKAVEDGCIEMVKFLLDNGADINAKDATCDKKTPLCIAVDKACPIYQQGNNAEDHQKYIEKYEEIAKLLIDRKADVNESNPLGWAVGLDGNIKLVKLLVKNGAVILDGHLHSAANEGKTNIAEFLIDSGANISTQNSQGDTPLHRATLRFQVDTIKLLVTKGAKVDVANNIGQTPLHIAAHLGCEKTILTLIELGADPWLKDHNGTTPIDHYVSEMRAWQSRVDWGFTQDFPRETGYLIKLSQAYNKQIIVTFGTMLLNAAAAYTLFTTGSIIYDTPHLAGAVAAVTATAFAAGRVTYEIFKPSTKIKEVTQEPKPHVGQYQSLQ